MISVFESHPQICEESFNLRVSMATHFAIRSIEMAIEKFLPAGRMS